jgi:hypothetical protein
MPLHWTIDATNRLVTIVAQGDVTSQDVDAYLKAVVEGGAVTYRKLFDGSEGETSMGPDDMLALGARFRTFHARGPVGPLAVVVPDGKADLVARMLGILATADRPMRVFRTVAPARRWIESLVT